MKHNEYQLQKQVCQWLSIQHPKVLFLSDTIASCKLTMGQAVRNKAIQKEGFKTPDLIILHPTNLYHGLFIELKIKSPFKKDGTLLKDEHLEGQQKTMEQLMNKGYKCYFAWSFEMATKAIEKYLEN
ncbi:MAG: hypothetical protein V4549_18055 [Bacteroidota bacterium]